MTGGGIFLTPDPSRRFVIFAHREGADAREVDIGQAGLFRPGVELRLNIGEVALRFNFRAAATW
jgi:hypothetical protein